ncbi:Quaternary ammonium compound-resistance protein SugE [Pseudonocardia sp. Ae706_Ps2]|uniref:DMT family transporter n=2 Tax=Pseudonocardia TaxID=1847 RepID=UPI00094B08A2|nr:MULTISPECIES: multidrug efflux SMR transporter [unclassified Pseudonocardia]OLM08358.1 Quaternary ammonium compound-resistance protein SugE [Pseudonocardia sp. Ae706_Ps2]OLM08594.1 Quaternary ammonium compound-resistance protein SugE [Pseudonocardia sp. Ae505_Ps2]OLM08604.1 Quaternary ammonium compound-resistance protein SugE [Pseudonocardia sp. Ae505_Ps2]OLM27775.1 Quaternary ammonium compound-resistance protein SugE [Pseudonocardia sp. Ae717_Ps2]
MAWSILIASGVLEAVWATALAASDGFKRRGPTIVFTVALVFSMAGLAIAMQSLPTGTSYAVWVGVGAVLTAGWAISSGKEKATPLKIILLAGLVGSVAALKVVS